MTEKNEIKKLNNEIRFRKEEIVVIDIKDHNCTEGQEYKAKYYDVKYVFITRFRLELPMYIEKIIDKLGYKAHLIGSTTYCKSVWGLSMKQTK